MQDTLIIIADGLADNVLLISESGRNVAQWGRRGAGPGEFRNVQRVFSKADTVVVYDPTQRRASFFSVERGFVRAIDAPWGLVGVLPGDSKIVSGNPAASSRGRSGPELWVDTLEVRIESAQGTSRVVTRVPDRTRIIDLTSGMNIIFAPYTREPHVAANAEQIVVADGSGDIKRYRTDGSSISTLRSPFPPERITRADLTRWIEHSVAETRSEQQPIWRKLFSGAEPPPTAPAHGKMVIDRNSRIWVQEYRAPHDSRPTVVVAIDHTNRVVLRTTLPATVRLLAASHTIVAFTVKDDLDVEVVHLYSVSCS